MYQKYHYSRNSFLKRPYGVFLLLLIYSMGCGGLLSPLFPSPFGRGAVRGRRRLFKPLTSARHLFRSTSPTGRGDFKIPFPCRRGVGSESFTAGSGILLESVRYP